MKTDEELVISARSGDIVSMNLLVEKYMPTASKKARRLCEGVQLHDADDLTQEAMIGFLSAVYSFDGGKGASFATYANVCMNNRLYSVTSAMSAKRFVPQSAIVSLENADGALNSPGCDPQELALTRYRAQRVSQLIETELSDFERRVIRLFLSGCGYGNIAQRLEADKKSVDNAMQRIRRKLAQGLDDTDNTEDG